jgi:hypothetical protein
LTSDRFLVQLSKLETAPTKSLSAEEISTLWDKIDKNKLVQYKLKVDMGPEVLEIAKADVGADQKPEDQA